MFRIKTTKSLPTNCCWFAVHNCVSTVLALLQELNLPEVQSYSRFECLEQAKEWYDNDNN